MATVSTARIDLVKHQPREHPVPCRHCFHVHTFNHNAICNPCQGKEIRPSEIAASLLH